MFQLRRAAFRLLANPPTSLVYRSRTITTVSRTAFQSSRTTSFAPVFQRRWASEEAQPTEDKPKESEGEGAEAVFVADAESALHEEIDDVVAVQTGEAIQQDVQDAVQAAESTSEEIKEAAQDTIEEGTTSNSDLTNPSTTSTQPPQQATIFIGNLFFDVSEEDLQSEFSRFGNVTGAKIIRDGRGLSRGFAYVEYDGTEAAEKAIEDMNQSLYEGRRIVVQAAQRNLMRRREVTLNPPSRTLFIGNMSFDMTDRDLNNLFKGIKNVIDVRVAIDRRTGQPRGFAHADFIDVKSAVDAQKILAEKESHGRQLRVDFSTSNTRNRPE